MDCLPKEEILNILQQYLPKTIFKKIYIFIKTEPKYLNTKICWNKIKKRVEKCNTKQCENELLTILQKSKLNNDHVKVFHIHQNQNPNQSTEPTHKNTKRMIYYFLISIYQRCVLSSLVKFILLKPIIKTFNLSTQLVGFKSVFHSMVTRLNNLIFENILTSFNGSKYDNYLLCNYLILLQNQCHQKIKIFKKGASLSTIHLIFKHNLLSKVSKSRPFKNNSNVWPIHLFIKDVRELVASNMSLDKIGQVLGLEVSKLCFPYEQAVSIKKLKSIHSLHPYDEKFWTNSFSGKCIPIEQRLLAQQEYENQKMSSLYDYNAYYLKIDCMLLHSVLLKIFHTYLQDNINIFIRRKFSQSSLAFQQFFVVEPSQQIEQTLAPVKINNPFYNYFIKQAVTGGLCTSFVHGDINTQTKINNHFNFLNTPTLDPKCWPNFNNLPTWKNQFHTTPEGIITLDIRSLYPSAALKKIPVGNPYFFSRFTIEDFLNLKQKTTTHLKINNFCLACQHKNTKLTDFFKLISKTHMFKSEYIVLNQFLKTLPSNIIILKFQTQFTAMGQLFFGNYPLDGFLSYKHNNKIFIKLIQYQSQYYHGHRHSCNLFHTPHNNLQKVQQTDDTRKAIQELMHNYITQFQHHFNQPVVIEYIEIFDCDFPNHRIPNNESSLLCVQTSYTYSSFLNCILNNQLSGFLVVKDLEIKKNNQNPIFGFIIQKLQYDYKKLSPYTQNLIKENKFSASKRVVSLHKNKSFMVISTEYFKWLQKTFGFEKTPDIYHALLFTIKPYLRKSIESKLLIRKNLKIKIKNENDVLKKQNFEIKAELIKLMLNSCYGFTMCNLSSTKFKFFENYKTVPKRLIKKNKIVSIIQLHEHCFLIEKNNQKENFETLLGHVGCSILFYSKIILLKRLYFLLKYLNPTQAQLLYMDTDSAHFLVQNKQIEKNVDINLQSAFLADFDKHFETGEKISGIWVQEGFFKQGKYLGEKCYYLFNDPTEPFLTHIKGLNHHFQTQIQSKNIDLQNNCCISYNTFQKTADFLILKTHVNKNISTFFVPLKRYFVCSDGSLPLKII